MSAEIIDIADMVKKLDNAPNRMREWRKRRRLTLEGLARLTGFDTSRLSRWEVGERHPNIPELRTIARALDVDIGQLLNAEDNATSLSEIETDVILTMRGAGSHAAEAVRGTVRSVAEGFNRYRGENDDEAKSA